MEGEQDGSWIDLGSEVRSVSGRQSALDHVRQPNQRS